LGAGLARQLGTSADQPAGVPISRLLQLEANRDGEMPLLTSLGQRRAFRDQRAVVRRTGAALLLSAEPIESPSGDFAGYGGRATLVGKAGDRAAMAGSAWDQLLRKPLDVIVEQSERIADRSEGPLRSDYAAYANDIAGAARHLLEVLKNMGREAKSAGEESERIDLAALAADAAGLVQAQAVEAGVTLELEGVSTLPAIGQARAVTQILVNVISNAVRHSPKGGAVRIGAEAGSQASVSVTDQGPGVAAKDGERIFERFEQAQPQGEGAGLGLAISRRLARSMGGDISLDSTPGKGARFTLSLPNA
jgi:signal transduction histidine kinase